jgi:hypothetical protein
MKSIFAVVATLTLSMTAYGQVETAPTQSPAPRPALISKALNMCPALISRTEAAAANGHTQYYYSYDCECLANSIDYNTWDEASATYSGPLMPDSDAYIIVGAIAASDTIEEAVLVIDANLSGTGYSAASACFGK